MTSWDRRLLGLCLQAALIGWPGLVGATPAVELDAVLAAPGPAPAQIYSGERLRARGHELLSEALAGLATAINTSPTGARFAAQDFRPVALRGLSPEQVQVLINGRPMYRSAEFNLTTSLALGAHVADLDAIPLLAVERVELYDRGLDVNAGSELAAINIVLKDTVDDGVISLGFGEHRTEIPVADLDFAAIGPSGNLGFQTRGDRNADDGDGERFTAEFARGFAVGAEGRLHLSLRYLSDEAANRAAYDFREQYPRLADGSLDPREVVAERLRQRVGKVARDELDAVLSFERPVFDESAFYARVRYAYRRSETPGQYRRPLAPENNAELYPLGYLPQLKSDIDEAEYLLGLRTRLGGNDCDFSVISGNSEIDYDVEDTLNPLLGVLSPRKFLVGNNESGSLRLDGVCHRPLAWLAGSTLTFGGALSSTDYEIEKGDSASTYSAAPAVLAQPVLAGSQGFSGFALVDRFDESQDAYALFGLLDTRLGDARIRAGLRADKVKGFDLEPGLSLRVQWPVAQAFTLEAALTRGFRAPSLAQQFYARTDVLTDGVVSGRQGLFASAGPAARALGLAALEPETTRGAFLGLTWQQEDLSVSLTAFANWVDDQILLTNVLSGADVETALADAGLTDLQNPRFVVNGGDVRYLGLDLSARKTWQTRRRGAFSLYGGVSLLDVSLSGTPRLPGTSTELVDDRLAAHVESSRPETRALLGLDWQRQRLSANVQLSAFGSVTDSLSDPQVINTTGDLLVLDASVGYDLTAADHLQIGAHNGLDEYPDPYADAAELADRSRLAPFTPLSPIGYDGVLLFLRYTRSL